MIEKDSLVVIMPVYNEEGSIRNVLEKWIAFLKTLPECSSFRIHVYNDGSRDRTGEILNELGKKYPESLVIHHKKNSGHGPSVLQGYRENARDAEWIFQIDSDDEMAPEPFKELWSSRKEYDFLTGRRKGRIQGAVRYGVSLVSRLAVRLFFGKTVWDVNTPYRLMRSSCFAEMFRQIPADTFAPNVLLSGMAGNNHLRLLEIEVPQKERQTGVVSIRKWKLLSASVKSFFQTFSFALEHGKNKQIFFVLLFLGILLRFLAGSAGHNFDYESYKIVSDLLSNGNCVYAETSRYNYGPVWFHVLHGIRWLCGENFFRGGLILFLTLCDAGCAAFLWKRHYRMAAGLLLLSPLAIYTTGYHNQFDNFAILFTLLALPLLEDPPDKRSAISLYKVIAGSCLLGFSLVIKHIFFFFPFWLFFHYTSRRNKWIVLLVPLMIFAGSFLPYTLPELTRKGTEKEIIRLVKKIRPGKLQHFVTQLPQDPFFTTRKTCKGILQNIVLYKSYDNKIFHRYFLPGILQKLITPGLLFFGGLLLAGYLLRRKKIFDLLMFYTAFLLILSTGITNQYLVIPGIFTAVFAYPFGFCYHLAGIVLLTGSTCMGSVYFTEVLLLLLICLCIYRKILFVQIKQIYHFLNRKLPY